jgi:hypothetical protein
MKYNTKPLQTNQHFRIRSEKERYWWKQNLNKDNYKQQRKKTNILSILSLTAPPLSVSVAAIMWKALVELNRVRKWNKIQNQCRQRFVTKRWPYKWCWGKQNNKKDNYKITNSKEIKQIYFPFKVWLRLFFLYLMQLISEKHLRTEQC